MAVITSFSITAMPAGVSFALAVDPERGRGDSGQLEVDLYEVLLELGEAAREAASGVVFLFDEMQFAERGDLAGLLAAFHRIGQLGLPVALVGAGLPQLAGRLAEASSYAERLLSYTEMGRLTEDAARAALTVPVEREGVRYTPPALELILERADRYPFFLQTWGKYAWQVARDSPITLTDAENADQLAAGAQRRGGLGGRRISASRCSTAISGHGCGDAAAGGRHVGHGIRRAAAAARSTPSRPTPNCCTNRGAASNPCDASVEEIELMVAPEDVAEAPAALFAENFGALEAETIDRSIRPTRTGLPEWGRTTAEA